jgi:hypothetical protein
MQRHPVQSTNVAEVGYDPDNMILEVLFHNGGLYQYFGVPEYVYRELLNAASIGRYVNDRIKDHYRFRRIR